MDKSLNLGKLKMMIKTGISSIPQDPKHDSAVLVIGDTGVGKSTIISALSGIQLYVRIEGMKAVLDAKNKEGVKIGHDKFSETSIPTKVLINDTVFFDCPGFKDNKGEQFQISNSFFVQRLLDIYPKCKILLVIDESHITEARADKLPKLLSNLLKSFKTFQDIKQGVALVINRADKDHKLEDYHHEIIKLAQLKNEGGYLFQQQSRDLLNYLVKNNKIFLFRSAQKDQKDKKFQTEGKKLLQLINGLKNIKSRHINNIISESAKLAIRDYIDQIALRSNEKIEELCEQIRRQYIVRRGQAGNDVNALIKVKEEVIALLDAIKQAKEKQLIDLLLLSVPPNKIVSFQEEFSAVMFFKNIYDKTEAYYSNLLNKIYSEISPLMAHYDKQIIKVQKEQEQKKKQAKLIQQFQERERQQKIKLEEQLKRQQEEQKSLKQLAQELQNLKLTNNNVVVELQSTSKKLKSQQEALESVKKQWKQDIQNKDQEIHRINGQLLQKNTQLQSIKRDSQSLSITYLNLMNDFDRLNQSVQLSQLSQSNISQTTSKKSKYQDIDCPHFKNGGKCIHCINKWKAEKKKH